MTFFFLFTLEKKFVMLGENRERFMDITVDRHQRDDELVFTIRVKNCLKIEKSSDLRFFDELTNYIENSDTCNADLDLKHRMLTRMRNEQYGFGCQIKESSHFDIKYVLQPKFNHICQEIYNWGFDQQSKEIQELLNIVDPGRTKFYFDNDPHATKIHIPQESEHDDEEDSDWDEDDN